MPVNRDMAAKTIPPVVVKVHHIQFLKTNFMKRLNVSFFIVAMLWISLPASNLAAQVTSIDNGDRIAWDGEYYDFRDAEGVMMIKLWVPPNVETVRGIFISGHGGGGGDSRNFARDENLRAFAARLGFGVAGLHNFPGRRVYNDGAPVFFKALDAFAQMGHHPELANVPFVMYGSSNGGAATYGFVNYAPERAICFVANVSAGYNPETPVEEALQVPGIFIIGKFDALIGERGIRRTQDLITAVRDKGALWSWALELKGHEDGHSFDIYMKLVEQAVKLRYPEKANPSDGPVTLTRLKEKNGWLTNLESWGTGLTEIASYSDYKDNQTTAGWLLNKDLAYVYRSLATHHNPLEIKVREFDRTYNPHTDPGTMFSLGGPVANPGDEITISCETGNLDAWTKIEFFNGAEKLGETGRDKEPELKIRLDGQNEVYCLVAIATTTGGDKFTSDPMHFFVRDPSIDWHAKLPVETYEGEKTNEGATSSPGYTHEIGPDPADSILIAYGLTANMEEQFSASDGKVSPFWDQIGENRDSIRMTQRRNAAGNAAFNFVLTHDCNMSVKAAYGADGIYLMIRINDDNDVAWPNELAGTENEQFYLNFDAVDLMIEDRSVSEIADPANSDMLLSRSFGLTTSTRQYQVACGTRVNRPDGLKRALADPWDFHGTYYTFEDAKFMFGLQIENIKTAPFFKVQEWFIPWSEVGSGLSGQPEQGDKVAFTVGFNDRDAGEHFPPGVNSSGGTVKASNALRWINKSDPWGSGTPPFNWGELLFGPVME